MVLSETEADWLRVPPPMGGREAAQPLAPLREHDLILLQGHVRYLVVLDERVLAKYGYAVVLFRLHQLTLLLP